jgi:predicted acylesterase/phospholipase RssA
MPHNLTEFDRACVVTIQGGGAHALVLLGQLEAVIAGGYQPLALAGTSFGAIIATLLWAGLTPQEIRDRFVEFARNPGMPAVLGPIANDRNEPVGWFGLQDLAPLKQRMEEGMRLFQGIRFWNMIVRVPRMWQIANDLRKVLEPHYHAKGIFSGDRLEQVIDDWIRNSERLRGARLHNPVRFRDIRDVMKSDDSPILPRELFLPATNLTTRKLELFNSVTDEYLNLSVAKAARASAGFPIGFRPVMVDEGPERGWFVDGGVVSNFPAWVFSATIRRQFAETERTRALVPRPWIHIGLKLSDEAPPGDQEQSPAQFGQALVGMMIGQSRNRLEDLLIRNVPRTILIEQDISKIQGPSHLFALNELDEKLIRTMCDCGVACANRILHPLDFRLPSEDIVTPILEMLVNQAVGVFGEQRRNQFHFRSNVFVVHGDRLILTYSYNTTGDPDEHMNFHFSQGLTGFCYLTRSTNICNLAKVHELADAEQMFAMTRNQQDQVRKDRTWLVSTPILDPQALLPGDMDSPRKTGTDYAASFPRHLDGPVLGVLNLDAALPYAEVNVPTHCAVQRKDPRIRAIMAVLESAALDIGAVLSQHYPMRGDRDEQ